MTTADKLLTQIKEDRENKPKAHVSLETDAINSLGVMATEFSVLYDKCLETLKFAFHFSQIANRAVHYDYAANTWERKSRQLEIAVEALNDIANRISVSGEDKDGGPDRVEISNDRNRRILDAKKALEDMEAVK